MTVSLYNCGHCKLPQLVGQRCHCRTPEDEAFDDLAKRQGDWGGGFPAKRAMAADKLQELPSEWAGIKAILDEYGLQAIDFVADFKASLAQSAQEPVMHLWECLGRWSAYLVENGKQADCAPPAWLVDAINKVTTPPQREWNFCERCGKRTKDLAVIHTCTPPQEGK